MSPTYFSTALLTREHTSGSTALLWIHPARLALINHHSYYSRLADDSIAEYLVSCLDGAETIFEGKASIIPEIILILV